MDPNIYIDVGFLKSLIDINFIVEVGSFKEINETQICALFEENAKSSKEIVTPTKLERIIA